MRAELVYDGQNVYYKPECMGTPKDTQLQGTARECVTELCGRICYDSLGKGRSSADYHAHIAEVGHGSVNEHTPIVLVVGPFDAQGLTGYLLHLSNRPGITFRILDVTDSTGGYSIRIVANFRAINEFQNFSVDDMPEFDRARDTIQAALTYYGHAVAPQIVATDGEFSGQECWFMGTPEFEDEKWITLYMSGSRGFSHEQVRHGDFTAISQRSTRYVDESGSEWFWHPLIQAYLAEGHGENKPETMDIIGEIEVLGLQKEMELVQTMCGDVYNNIVKELQPWMISKGADKLSARKQARGAARGFLGNALKTEMMFSASVDQWHRMLAQRASHFADAEIREIYAREENSVIEALQKSQYSDDFQQYKVVKSEDGIGTCLRKL